MINENLPENYLFMSYRSSEADIALKIARDLRTSGIFVWMDQLEGLTTGVNWVAGLENAIDGASGMIVMLSPDYLTSKFCRRELLRADGLNYNIFPVLIEDIDNRPLELQSIQHIDMRDWQNDEFYQSQLNTVKRHISNALSLENKNSYETVINERTSEVQLARRVEDQLQHVQEYLQHQKPQKRSLKMRKTRLEEQISQYEREYDLAKKQMQVELSEVYRDRLTNLMFQIETKIDDIGEELDSLNA